jgi:hypothetical protein
VPFTVLKPDTVDQHSPEGNINVFLAGTIDNGKASLWAHDVAQALKDIENVTIFNPRREEWFPDLEARMRNPIFNHQVNWELDSLDPLGKCNIPFFYFEGGSISPITLQELGFVIGSIRGLLSDRDPEILPPVVCCPDDFWRKGNVEIMCSRHDIPIYDDLQSAIRALRRQINLFSSMRKTNNGD